MKIIVQGCMELGRTKTIIKYLLIVVILASCSKEKFSLSEDKPFTQMTSHKLVKQYEEYATTPGQSDYKFYERITIDYNGDGTPSKVTIFGNYVNPNPSTFRTYGYEYEYDNDKNIVKSYLFGGGISETALDGVYNYNSNNQIVGATIFSGTSVAYKDTWTYPSPGSRVLSRVDGNGNPLLTEEFYFDDNGNCVHQHTLSPVVDVNYFMSYDNHPSPGSGVFYDFMNDHSDQSWVLNNRNNWIKESTFNTLSNVTYDSDGYPSVVVVDMVGRKRIYTYVTQPSN